MARLNNMDGQQGVSVTPKRPGAVGYPEDQPSLSAKQQGKMPQHRAGPSYLGFGIDKSQTETLQADSGRRNLDDIYQDSSEEEVEPKEPQKDQQWKVKHSKQRRNTIEPGDGQSVRLINVSARTILAQVSDPLPNT